MESKVEIVSKEIVKPSSPTPNHLKDFKISLLDEMVPPTYVPIILFYCATTDDSSSIIGARDFEVRSNKLKLSLSKILSLYYPFCGRLKATSSSSVDCNDEGVLYIESKIPTNLSDTLKLPQSQIQELLLPFDPYDVPSTMENYDRNMVNMAVQLSEFKCGGIALGVCLSHKLADAAATASFLNSWAETARDIDNGGNGNIVEPPQMDASLIFPPRGIELAINDLMVGGDHDEKLVTKCFLFNATNICSLKARFGDFNATRVEAITALIWRSAIQAAKATSEEENIDLLRRAFSQKKGVAAFSKEKKMRLPRRHIWRWREKARKKEEERGIGDATGSGGGGERGAMEALINAPRPLSRPVLKSLIFKNREYRCRGIQTNCEIDNGVRQQERFTKLATN
ncbi:hypothetical protein PIB30_061522 [Stylosanthes scabra]|uniref:Uncharacterized protein n=1 Tax=Stylosanthes scabra TaxID=79078 RepID=A0ABU6XL04_9FABA|nr:hypothetical protein [Stylosanthes scabra]